MQLFRKLNSERWAIAFLICLPFLFYFNWFSWFQTHFWTYGDGEYSYISYRKILVDAWSSFSLPTWNEYINLGLPLGADPQFESFYPLNLLYLIFPFPVALNGLIMLHFSMAAVFTYVFLREIELTRFSSLIGAIIFAFCGAINTRRGHVSVQHTLVWLPLLFYAYERVAKTHNLRSICLLALACGMQFFAGFVQGCAYSYLLLFVYMIYSLSRYPSKKTWMKEALLFGGVTIALISSQLSFTLITAQATKRTSIPYDVFVSYSFPLKHLRTLINPFFFGMAHPGKPFKIFNQGYFGEDNMSEFACYVGALPLIAFLYLLFRRQKPRHTIFWITAGTLAMTLALGGFFPWLAKLVFHFPMLKSFRVPARFLFLFDFALATLAAICLNTVKTKDFDPRYFRICIWVYCTVVAGITWLSFHRGSLAVNSLELWTTPAFALALLIIGEVFLRRGLSHVRGFQVLLTLFVILDLWSFAFFNSNIFTPDTLSSKLAQEVRRLDPMAQYRILTIPGVNGDLSYDSLGHDRNMIHKIRATTGYTTFVPKTFMESLRCDEAGSIYDYDYFFRNRHLVSAFNTKWIIINNGDRHDRRYRLLSDTYPYLKTFGDYDIFENPDAMPLVFGASRTVHSSQSVIDGFDYRRIAIVEDNQIVREFSEQAVVSDIRQSNGQITALVHSSESAFLVISETFTREWRAFVDDVPAEITKTNGLLMGLSIPPGQHRIKIFYQPTLFYSGLGMSAITLLFIIIVMLSRWGNKRV